MADEVDITPSPRILQVLGDIEYEHWQCLAELIDNGFDEHLDIKRAELPWDEVHHVTVVVPKATDPAPAIEVRDNGRGMSVAVIREAVRAGFSGNDQFEKLGLFGMGFNISTARLGGVARVLSKEAGAPEWRGVELDLQKISSRGEFKAPVVTEPADDAAEHGTRVIISRLKPEPRDYLSRPTNMTRLRARLGDVYANLLDHDGFKLYVGGQPVRSRRACTWDKSREVTRTRYGRKDVIPAVIEVDHQLPDMNACSNCRHWQAPDLTGCEVCGSTSLTLRERRIRGWVGIQRYTHPSDFGLDFIRNGRKILLRDKRLFSWQDSMDDANEVREYPVEVPYEGRIVGEIHIDHVPVNYQKNAFEYDGAAWKQVIRLLRGDGPLQPKKRKEAGFNDANDSPLARLFDGYRRNDPGLGYLVPGNGQAALKERAREWAKAFRDGKTEFQTDERWYEAAKRHDELLEQAKLAGVGAVVGDSTGDVLDEMGLGGDTPDPAGAGAGAAADPAVSDGSAAPNETEQERQERYKAAAEELDALTGEYVLPGCGPMKISAYLVSWTVVANMDGAPAPVWLSPRKGSAGWYAFIDAHAPIFATFGSDRTDIFLAELAYHMKTRSGSALPLTRMIDQLKTRHLADLKLDPQTLSSAARELLAEIGDRMADHVGLGARTIWSALEPSDRSRIETRATMAGEELDADPGANGGFLRYLPAMLVPRVVDRHPAEVLNGQVLSANYTILSGDNEEARQVLRGRVVSYLTDLALIAEVAEGRPVGELQRSRYTIELVRDLVGVTTAPADHMTA